MRKLMAIVVCLALGLLAGIALAGQDKPDRKEPQVSGTTRGNVGCVLLEKHMPIKGKLLLAGVVYARTEYRVIQTFKYKLDKQKFTGPGEIQDLNRLAAKDKIKLVILPSGYTEDDLDAGRKACQDSTPAPAASPDGGTTPPPQP